MINFELKRHPMGWINKGTYLSIYDGHINMFDKCLHGQGV